MKVALSILVVLFIFCTGVTIFCFVIACNTTTPEKRERQVIASTLQQYKYDTIVGHLSIFKVIPDTVSRSGQFDLIKTHEVGNYIFSITLSNASISADSMQRQSQRIAQTVSKDILLNDTTQYRHVIIQMFEKMRDSIFSFHYKVAELKNLK